MVLTAAEFKQFHRDGARPKPELVGLVLERFLRAGADPYLLLTSSTNKTGPVTLKLGHDSSPVQSVFHDLEYDDFKDMLMFKNLFTLRGWVDSSDLPNQDTLLDLIDRGLAAQQSSDLNEEQKQEENKTPSHP